MTEHGYRSCLVLFQLVQVGHWCSAGDRAPEPQHTPQSPRLWGHYDKQHESTSHSFQSEEIITNR